mgnify:CR=1 FL=1
MGEIMDGYRKLALALTFLAPQRYHVSRGKIGAAVKEEKQWTRVK